MQSAVKHAWQERQPRVCASKPAEVEALCDQPPS